MSSGFGVRPVRTGSEGAPVTPEDFPDFLQFRFNGVDLGGPDATTVNFVGGAVTVERGTGDDANKITVRIDMLSAPVVPVTTANHDVLPAEAGSYFRFTATGAKTATFDAADGFVERQEFHVTNRAASGNVTLTPVGGMVLNVPKGGTLVLEPGDTVTVKMVDVDEADVMGSVDAA